MTVQYLHTNDAPAAIGPYSQATTAGGFLFTAGQIALDPATTTVVAGDITAQAEQVMANLNAVLATAGCGWNDVVKTTIFLTTMDDFAQVNEVYGKHLGATKPARSTVAVAGLPRGVRVEIECIAKLP
ncbi:reactive intermediate/imine deaminase [Gemmatimonadota bacterium]|nr:reactive intermediate/imine deaminase [Gemmatimonadota bacterium]